MKIISFFAIVTVVCGLYEDQIGKFDWRQQFIGRVTQLYWDQSGSSGGGKRMFVATDKHVIATLNTANGNIVNRVVFEENERGEIGDFLYTGKALLSMVSGTRLNAINPATSIQLWEHYLTGEPGHSGQVGFIEGSDLAVGMSSQKVIGVQMSNGELLWEVELPNSDVVQYRKLEVYDGKVYVVGMATGTEVKVMVIEADGTVINNKSELAGFLRKDTVCEIVQGHYLMCLCPASESLQVLNLQQPQGFTSTSLQDLGLSEGVVDVIETSSAGTVICQPTQACALVTVATNNKIKVKQALPKAVLATVVQYEDTDYLLYLEYSAKEELTILGYDLASGEQLSEFGHKITYAQHNGRPSKMYGLLARRPKDGKLVYRVALVSQDCSLQLIHKTGKVAWRREESIAYTATVDMLDLPVSENQAKFEDEFGSHEDNLVTMFLKRVKTQLSQLQTFVHHTAQKLQGVKQHVATIQQEEEDEEDVLRDDFSLHKMMVLITEVGKVIGMRSHNAHIVWEHFIPDLAPFDRFGRRKFVFHTQRTTAHFPHPPQCVILGKNKQTGRGHLFAFNPITGERASQMPAGGQHLAYSVKQAFILGVWDEDFMKALVMLDETDTIQVYPSNMLPFVREQSSHVYVYLADTDNGLLNGYRLLPVDNKVTVDKVWTVNLQNQRQNMKITHIVAKASNEHTYSQGRVLGDRSVLYKYLNPNLVVVTTEGEEPATTNQKAYPVFNLYVIDVVTGHMIFHGNHRKAQGPLHVVHSENWVVYGYYSTRHHRSEFAALEMYEGKNQSNSTAFSSFTAPLQPLTVRQSFIFPLPIYTMATTITEKGITTKDIIIALKNGGIFHLPKALLDPRRPLTPTQETHRRPRREEGTYPYVPELPVMTEGVINYNQTLYHIRGIHTSPTGLESTSLVLAYGLDVFFTQVQPSKKFDVLKEDFEHWLIALVVLSMMVASFITQKLAARRALSRQWK